MADVLKLIVDTSTSDIQAAGMWWRVRKIRTSDLFAAGAADLAVASGSNPAGTNRRPSAREIIDAYKMSEAMVCAGLVAASADGADWQNITAVADERKEDHTGGTVHVGRLPAGVVDTLAAEILRLSTDGGAAAERLAAFRVQTEPRAARGRAR